MDKFKFDEKERDELYDLMGVLNHSKKIATLDRIETLISSRADVDGSSLPAPTQDGTNYAQCTCRNGLEAFKNCGHGQEEPPTQDGTAEEVLQELLDIEYHDDPQYANLESALISRKYCIQAMHNYDAPLRAEIAGLVQTIESHREQRELDRICYENKLTEANQRVKELEEKVQAKEVLLIGYRDLTEGMI